jgi:hypothetical protein
MEWSVLNLSVWVLTQVASATHPQVSNRGTVAYFRRAAERKAATIDEVYRFMRCFEDKPYAARISGT